MIEGASTLSQHARRFDGVIRVASREQGSLELCMYVARALCASDARALTNVLAQIEYIFEFYLQLVVLL